MIRVPRMHGLLLQTSGSTLIDLPSAHLLHYFISGRQDPLSGIAYVSHAPARRRSARAVSHQTQVGTGDRPECSRSVWAAAPFGRRPRSWRSIAPALRKAAGAGPPPRRFRNSQEHSTERRGSPWPWRVTAEKYRLLVNRRGRSRQPSSHEEVRNNGEGAEVDGLVSLAENDLAWLACEIERARGSLEHVTGEMRGAVAGLRGILASDAAGLRVAWPEPAGSTHDFGACCKPELDGDRPGQMEQRVASRLERRTP